MIDFELDGPVALITLRGADDRNLLSSADIQALGAAWQRFGDEDDAEVAIVRGAGTRSFCAGADVGDLGTSLSGPGVGAVTEFGYTMKGRRVPKPVIAAVNGHAVGAGVEILLGTDIRVAVPRSTFGLPEVRWAAVPVGGSVARLPRQVPYAWAARMLLTGERISSEDALRAGLVTEIVEPEQLDARVRSLAERVLANSPAATRGIKEAMVRAEEASLAPAHLIETLYADRVAGTRDAQEAVAAFRERRDPRYRR